METLDEWRRHFKTAISSDIFVIIEKAIEVAASDQPKEFRCRRDRIAEHLFSCRLARCSGCHRIQLSVPEDRDPNLDDVEEDEEDEEKVSKYNYGEAEALSDEMEEASLVVGEVFRIKDLLLRPQDQVPMLILSI